MAVYQYQCKECDEINLLFSSGKIMCPCCGCTDMERLLPVPLKARNLERGDTYHNIQALPGIKEDVKKRNKTHMNSELKETIDEFGKDVAKEQGWIDPKTGKIRTDWDEK